MKHFILWHFGFTTVVFASTFFSFYSYKESLAYAVYSWYHSPWFLPSPIAQTVLVPLSPNPSWNSYIKLPWGVWIIVFSMLCLSLEHLYFLPLTKQNSPCVILFFRTSLGIYILCEMFPFISSKVYYFFLTCSFSM
jgi:hypothetical protein